jgi:extracellular factor (EF) 3-hydroxypalmitic acid methyl ester biosynthesis protein
VAAEFPAVLETRERALPIVVVKAERELALGPCRFYSNAANPLRRHDAPPPVGDGRQALVGDAYDFGSLHRAGRVLDLQKRLEQIPVLWARKQDIRPAFREYVAELVYDLQVYRSAFEEIDRQLAHEPYEVRGEVHRVATRAEYPRFKELFDNKLAELEALVKGFSHEEHERHGVYLRKHAWDIIRASEFLLRTNLKPRGYAGDSMMMRMLYENEFRGSAIFERFIHRHPIETEAAQAVRNRVGLLSSRIGRLGREMPAGQRVRIMSVASGPAWEMREVFRRRTDLDRFEVSLLDQDGEALAEAEGLVALLEATHQAKLHVRYIHESVRTMLRDPAVVATWGKFTFVYSMGLFDYLNAPVARAVLAKLYDLLEPGGELVIGNFHVNNPTRTYLEYWMDWVLLHRSEAELLALADGLNPAQSEVIFEDTGSQMFLVLRKGG